ncbi:MAG: hypothetical protein AB7T06_07050 [Kofleriaceae bacterium]
MTPTKPLGPRTDRVVDGCYARLLRDCDGRISAEHYVSDALLRRFKPDFTVEGPSWATVAKRVGPSALTAKVLCQRHNEALSGLDAMIGEFYDFLRAAIIGPHAGSRIFDGEDLERWAMKALLGLAVSGNIASGGKKARAAEVPELYLRILFGDEEMPARCGFKYIAAKVPDLEANQLTLALNHHPLDGGERSGQVFGLTIRMLNSFQYATSITEPLETLNDEPLYHRPAGIQLGDPERGRLGLRWGGGEWRPGQGIVISLATKVPPHDGEGEQQL